MIEDVENIIIGSEVIEKKKRVENCSSFAYKHL